MAVMNHGLSVGIYFIQDRQHPSVNEAMVEVELDNGQHQFFGIQILGASKRFLPEAVPVDKNDVELVETFEEPEV